ncbi:acylneuraminate cytidylyltransferase family protein [Flavobacterium sp.]|uniref:acylneuraminate cytidylyltransferase family protein n=1 Tax=Flavobacterium sp. TaxID=239 RepID=UPI0040475AE9
MRILGLITARGGSKGVPKKNIKLLNGKPLLAYTVEAANRSKLITDLILSTDDDAIIQVAENIGLQVPFKRPEELAVDSASSIDVVSHALQFFESKGIFYDAICLLQPTSPFRKDSFIDEAIEKFINQKTDCLLSVLQVPHEYNPHWTFLENENGTLDIATGEKEIIKRRQDLPVSFFRDGSIYITKTTVIKERHSFYGESISYIESDPQYFCNIDTLKDWEIAEAKVLQLRIK